MSENRHYYPNLHTMALSKRIQHCPRLNKLRGFMEKNVVLLINILPERVKISFPGTT